MKMKKTPTLRRLMALLLFLLLLGSLAPAVYAAEEGSIPDETAPSTVDPPNNNQPNEEDGNDPPEGTPNLSEPDSDADLAGISLFSNAGISLFSATPSYATWRQMTDAESPGGKDTISYIFNGKTYTHDNLVLIGLDLNQDGEITYDEAAYCIEPGAHLDSSFTYLPTETSVSDAWGNLTDKQCEAIGLALLYGFPNGLIADSSGSTATQNKYNAHYQLATAIIVHEICIGYRSASSPYTCTNPAYYNFFYTKDIVWAASYGAATYKDGVAGTSLDKALLKEAYDYIANKMAKHSSSLSFASVFSVSAPTYDMVQNSNGTCSVTLTDTNGVLADYVFPQISGVTFSKIGNSLTITASSASAIPSTVIAPTRTVPSPDDSAYLIWNGSNSGQQLLSLKNKVSDDPVPAYFKLRLGTGTLKIVKSTNTGANLSGWQFTVYSDAACTNAVAGPLTSGSDGTISTTLVPGTYYIKETGGPSGVDLSYWSSFGSVVKKVTVSTGATTSVSFTNTQYGRLSLVKTTNTGANLSGWKFGVYSNSSCTTLVTTLTTDANGKATSGNLTPGLYYIKEISTADGYWSLDTSVKSVTVVAGKTTAVSGSFVNTHYGKVKIIKTMDTDGSAARWRFEVYRYKENGDPSSSIGSAATMTLVGTYTTAANGTITTKNLLPGTYVIKEIIPENSLFYCKSELSQIVTVTEGQTAEVTFTNALRPGKISIEKVNFLGEHLAGAKFLLEWSNDGGNTWTPVTYSDKADVVLGGCTSDGLVDSCLVTGEDGIITFEGLYPGLPGKMLLYRLTEVEAPDGYVLLSDYAFQGELPIEDLTVSLTVCNAPGYEMPMTGAYGPILACIGAALVVGCSVYLILGKKRKTN